METKTVNTELWLSDKSSLFVRTNEKPIAKMFCDSKITYESEALEYQELIVTAVNACKQINAANPHNAAHFYPYILKALRKLIKVCTETTKDIVAFDGADELDKGIDEALKEIKLATE